MAQPRDAFTVDKPKADSCLPWRTSNRNGMSIIELLVVVLILGVALAIAIPNYLASQNYSKLQACKANMAAIYQAEESYRVRNRDYNTTVSTLSADMGGLPKCPNGTVDYTVTKSGTGSALALVIKCPNANAHATNKMQTTDGTTFTFAP